MGTGAIVCFIIAIVCFLLVLVGLTALGPLSISTLGFLFLAIGLLLEALPGVRRA
jgi:hypothetical protein